MNRILLTLCLLLVAGRAYGQAALITSATAGGSSTATTSAVNTTGSTLFVGALSYVTGNSISPAILSDSQSNAWSSLQQLAGAAGSSGAVIQLFYCLNPATSSSHTFSFKSAPNSPGGLILVYAFSNSVGNFSFAQTSGSSGGAATSVSAGSLSPTSSNALFLAAAVSSLSSGGSGSITWTSTTGATTGILSKSYSSAGWPCSALSYLAQSTTAAENPAYAASSSTLGIVQAIFNSVATGGGGGCTVALAASPTGTITSGTLTINGLSTTGSGSTINVPPAANVSSGTLTGWANSSGSVGTATPFASPNMGILSGGALSLDPFLIAAITDVAAQLGMTVCGSVLSLILAYYVIRWLMRREQQPSKPRKFRRRKKTLTAPVADIGQMQIGQSDFARLLGRDRSIVEIQVPQPEKLRE